MIEVPFPDMLTPANGSMEELVGRLCVAAMCLFRGTVNFTLEEGIVTLIEMEVTAVEIPIFRGPLQLEKIDSFTCQIKLLHIKR